MKNKYIGQKSFIAFVMIAFAGLLSVSAEQDIKMNLAPNLIQQEIDSAWIEVGPGNVAGRIRALLWDHTNDSVVYAGGVAGGLFKSTNQGKNWSRVEGDIGKMPISCIFQDLEGNIYVGTGEGFSNSYNSKTSFTNKGTASASIGNGIYKASAGSTTFNHLSGTTVQDPLDPSDPWAYVNRISAVGDVVYAATNTGIYYLTNAGQDYEQTVVTNISQDIKITSDGKFIYFTEGQIEMVGVAAAYVFKLYKTSIENLNLSDRVEIAVTGATFGRIEIALTKDPNIFYFGAINPTSGAVEGIYLSRNGGEAEPIKISQGIDQNRLKDGAYSFALAVNPQNPDIIYVGGYALQYGTHYQGDQYYWTSLGSSSATTSSSRISSTYLHENIHNIVFHPNPKTTEDSIAYFVATDGGVSIYHSYTSLSSGEIEKGFEVRVKNLNTSQISSLGVTNNGDIVAGLYGDGSLYMEKSTANALNTADLVYWTKTSNETSVGGPVFGSIFQRQTPNERTPIIFSQINSNLARVTGSYYSVNDQYWTYGNKLYIDSATSTTVPVALMWETINDSKIKDSISCPLSDGMRVYRDVEGGNLLEVGDTIKTGDSVLVTDTKKLNYPFWYTFGEDFPFEKDTIIQVKTPLQNRYFIAGNQTKYLASGNYGDNIYVTSQMLDLSADTVKWVPFYKYKGVSTRNTEIPLAFAISKDGNHFFFAVQASTTTTTEYRLYRIKDVLDFDINAISPTLPSADLIGVFKRTISSLYVDPNDEQRLLVTFSEIGSDQDSNILYSDNALSSVPSFSLKQGFYFDTKIPIYTSLIEMSNSNIAYIGTEKGAYKTINLLDQNPEWSLVGNGIPVRKIYQQQQNIPTTTVDDRSSTGSTTSVFVGTSNVGAVYFATYGSGIYADLKTYTKPSADTVHLTVEQLSEYQEKSQIRLTISPNPLKDRSILEYSLSRPSNVVLKIYGVGGNLQYQKNLGRKSSGKHQEIINSADLRKGVAIIQVITDIDSRTINAIVR